MTIGTVNGYVPMTASRDDGADFTFDGTLKGLSVYAQKAGCKAGDVVYAFDRKYRLTDVSEFDDRAGGVWPKPLDRKG
jgi:hypothetical protein